MNSALLAKAFDRLPDPALVVSLDDGAPVAANRAFAAATAITRHEVLETEGEERTWRLDEKGWRPLVRALKSVPVAKAPRLALLLGDERVEMPDVRLERLDIEGDAYVLITSRGAATTPATRITPLPDAAPVRPADGDSDGDEAARLRAVVDTVAAWIVVTDRDGLVEMWNETARHKTGFERSQTVGGRKLWELLFPDPALRAGIVARTRAVIERGESIEDFETEVARADGSSCRASWTARQLVDETGAPAGMVALARDIDRERRRLQRLRSGAEETAWLLDGARELLATRDVQLQCSLAARRMRGLFPNTALVFVETVDEDRRQTSIRAVGASSREKAFVTSIVGQEPETVDGRISERRLAALRSGRLGRCATGIDDLFEKLLPAEVSRTLAGYTGSDEARRVGLVAGNAVVGAITVLGQDGPDGPHNSQLEAFAECLARALDAGRSSSTTGS